VAAAVPVLMLVLGGLATMSSMGMSMMDLMRKLPDPAMQAPMMKGMHAFMAGYVRYAIGPAVIVLAFLWAYASGNYPRLANRIAAGAAANFIASLTLDAVRLIGVAQGAFPGDMPTMMGQMIVGRMSMDSGVRLAGYTYHLLLNGTTFGIMCGCSQARRTGYGASMDGLRGIRPGAGGQLVALTFEHDLTERSCCAAEGVTMATQIDRNGVQKMLADGAQLVEVLPGKEYEAEHIPGALNIPLKDFGREAMRRLDSSRPVIVYCYDYQ
jgi:hypothetical protein